ncbi:myotubularin-related protein 14-like isoform X2 [Dreissena polymorpha]|uniref:myotubularin-related protein 14-like isoform X1 n=1 Tax=Dreissena polymorpha TaxID=45954 RepID=UPI002263B06A|nr:myotubularin-related protein 14-like isoform X1 [Dreissena polymorpha]XP_052285663.1 myotubularin-related protein 14-like isoform X2 [Dreissena polymorpha]
MKEESTDVVVKDEIHNLIEVFSKKSYKVTGDTKVDPVAEKCLKLFSKDYHFSVINNTVGSLCAHYPSKIVILEYERACPYHERVESLYDGHHIKELFKQARFARCRSRFVVPVILLDGKYVCRSATLASGAEMYGRSGLDFLTGNEHNPSKIRKTSSDSDLQMFDRVRGQDINILKTFSVKYIVDLMVEKKKVKFGMNVTSSEKVDKENRYGEFCIISAPYPGCEFFKEWRDNGYMGEDMKFDWSQSFVDACLDIPPTELLQELSIDWQQYKHWDLIQLTKNYLKMLVHMFTNGDKGILVHCISGWDRTPMFVSLLRLTLWADGLIHKSLSATEILYLTLAYDWYLFGHSLSDRLMRGEEILLFCFYFLPHIATDEFSVQSLRSTKRQKSSVGQDIAANGFLRTTGDTYSKEVRKHLSSVGSGGSSSGSARISVERKRNSSSSSLSSNGSFTIEPCSRYFLQYENDEDVIDEQSDVSAQTSSNCTLLQTTPCQRSSSPMMVPENRGRQSSLSDSPTCGSWQVISESGSLLSTELGYSASKHSSGPNSCEEPSVCEQSERWTRLDTVGRLFNNAYHNKVTTKYVPESNGITNLLDSFAGKFGFRK